MLLAERWKARMLRHEDGGCFNGQLPRKAKIAAPRTLHIKNVKNGRIILGIAYGFTMIVLNGVRAERNAECKGADTGLLAVLPCK